MLGVTDFWMFVVAGIMLNILPGPDSLYIVGRSAAQGFKAGSAAAFGIGSGTIVHILAAAFGLSAILATSALAFTVVKFIGAAYLLYMAFTLLMSKPANTNAAAVDTKVVPLGHIFYQGFLTNFLNPKVALFFLAFVPQFIDPNTEHKALAFIFLGVVFNINGMIWCHILAWSASFTSSKIKQSERMTRYLKRAAAGMFGYFGVKLALTDL